MACKIEEIVEKAVMILSEESKGFLPSAPMIAKALSGKYPQLERAYLQGDTVADIRSVVTTALKAKSMASKVARVTAKLDKVKKPKTDEDTTENSTTNSTTTQGQAGSKKQTTEKTSAGSTANGALTDEQQVVHDEIIEFFSKDNKERVHTLDAPGGTGKTYTVSKVGEHVKLKWFAPSHAAKTVLTEGLPTDEKAKTLQSGLGMKEDRNGKFIIDPSADRSIRNGDYVVVDEASMIPEYLYNELLSAIGPSGKVLFMGDRAQLPPIRSQEDSEELASSGFSGEISPALRRTGATLTEIMRFVGDSMIGTVAIKLRTNALKDVNADSVEKALRNIAFKDDGNVDLIESLDDAVNSILDDYKSGIASVAITFNNEYNFSYPASVGSLNKRIREALQPNHTNDYVVGDELVMYDTKLHEDDDKTLGNSERLTVTTVAAVQNHTVRSDKAELTFEAQEVTVEGKLDSHLVLTQRGLAALTNYFKKKRAQINKIENLQVRNRAWVQFFTEQTLAKMNFGQARYGYAITSHKAQGQTFDKTYVMVDNIAGATANSDGAKAKSLYVAASRAKSHMTLVGNLTKVIGKETVIPKKGNTQGTPPKNDTKEKGEESKLEKALKNIAAKGTDVQKVLDAVKGKTKKAVGNYLEKYSDAALTQMITNMSKNTSQTAIDTVNAAKAILSKRGSNIGTSTTNNEPNNNAVPNPWLKAGTSNDKASFTELLGRLGYKKGASAVDDQMVHLIAEMRAILGKNLLFNYKITEGLMGVDSEGKSIRINGVIKANSHGSLKYNNKDLPLIEISTDANGGATRITAGSPIQTLAHEIVHLYTTAGLRNNDSLNDAVQRLMDRVKPQLENKPNSDEYANAWLDTAEFVAEVLTNESLRKAIKVLKTPEARGVYAKVKKIFNSIMRGIGKVTSKDSEYIEALALAAKAINGNVDSIADDGSIDEWAKEDKFTKQGDQIGDDIGTPSNDSEVTKKAPKGVKPFDKKVFTDRVDALSNEINRLENRRWETGEEQDRAYDKLNDNDTLMEKKANEIGKKYAKLLAEIDDEITATEDVRDGVFKEWQDAVDAANAAEKAQNQPTQAKLEEKFGKMSDIMNEILGDTEVTGPEVDIKEESC